MWFISASPAPRARPGLGHYVPKDGNQVNRGMEVENNVMAEPGKGSRKGEPSSPGMRLGREVGPPPQKGRPWEELGSPQF